MPRPPALELRYGPREQPLVLDGNDLDLHQHQSPNVVRIRHLFVIREDGQDVRQVRIGALLQA